MIETVSGLSKHATELHSKHPDILSAAYATYYKVGQSINLRSYTEDTVYKKRLCNYIATDLCARLVDLGYDFETVSRELPLLRPWRTVGHKYLRSSANDPEPIIVDGAWQQFVPRRHRTDDLPQVAVGTSEEIVGLAMASGVHERYLDFWRPLPDVADTQEATVLLLPNGFIA